MSAFTQRLRLQWLIQNGYTGPRARRGDGGCGPHGSEAKRREGYPTDQRADQKTCRPMPAAQPMRATEATPRTGKQCASDATSRPEKPAVQSLPHSPFLP